MRELPADIVEEAERLTRLARRVEDDDEAAAYRRERDRLLADHEFTARVRSENHDVLVLHPEEWVDDGTIYPDRIDEIDRAAEIPLEGPGEAEEWDEIDEHNRSIVADVHDEHGAAHGANAEAFADFVGNHYAKPIEDVTPSEIEEFLTEYYPRNVWPTEKQAAIVETSVQHVFEATDADAPIDDS